ncbi:MAG: TonB-dependent receptor family protein, partial [Bacteroidales bacterium]|nr:TonB-dependent receptor family protein [Bacteroidales bacterium]
QHRFGGFTLKGGLRSELLSLNLDYPDSPADNVRKLYWGLFPSIHLSYRTKNMHNFKLSYTRRVSNPQASDLTTYRRYGEDSFSTGNPDLRQAFTNSVEAGWTKYINKFGNVGVNAWFKNTKDEFSSLADVCYDPFFGRMVYFSQPINTGITLNTGAEVNVTYQLKSFMNIRFYGNVYYTKSAFQFRDEDQPYTTENLGYSFRLNFWAKLWKVLEVNAAANYQSQNVFLFTTVRPSYSIDLGLRAEFWKRRIAVWVNVDDLFDWNRSATVNANPYYSYSDSTRVSYRARTVRFGLSFKFGKMELEGSQAGQQATGNRQQAIGNRQ